MTSFNIYDHATQDQIESFEPTFLYIKQHKITGLLYFGKTVKTGKAFDQYKGSGKYWNSHLKTHGKAVETIWFCYFTDIYSLVEFAINFSTQENIKSSQLWANLCEESGLQGGITTTRPLSEECKRKISKSLKGRTFAPEHLVKLKESAGHPHTQETKHKLKQLKTGTERSKESREKQSQSSMGHKKPKNFGANLSLRLTGVPKTDQHRKNLRSAALLRVKIKCPQCDKECTKSNYARWHGEKCKKAEINQPL